MGVPLSQGRQQALAAPRCPATTATRPLGKSPGKSATTSTHLDMVRFGPVAGVSAMARLDSNQRPTDYEAKPGVSRGVVEAMFLALHGDLRLKLDGLIVVE